MFSEVVYVVLALLTGFNVIALVKGYNVVQISNNSEFKDFQKRYLVCFGIFP